MKKYLIITYGCQMNEADSERIATLLERKGYKPAPDEKEADFIIVNMCSVRQTAVDRIWGKTKELARLKIKNKKLKTVLTGCIIKTDRKKFLGLFDEIWQNKDFSEIPPKCQKKSAFLVPISNGCNNSCTYCVVPETRGKLICRDHKKILKEIKISVKNGAKEIWLLGQNVNDYASPADASINFAKLLKAAAGIPGNFKIRFMSPNPKNFTKELMDVMTNSKKIDKFLHLPLQSGDNKILKKMNRPYTVEQYEKLVREIREKIPDINLTTDAIVGFPGETRLQFLNTVKLFKKIKFNLAYISKYSARPGTAAFSLKDTVSLKEKKRREKILREIITKNAEKL
ncbi:MAG: MiaB/RimO family radical SAM methylthiotransferase [Parcubacteria group bacterium]